MQPLAQPPDTKDAGLTRWLFLLWRRINATSGLAWSIIDKTGSNLTDLETRNHADLQNINTANYTHLTSTNHTDLTDGGDSALHYHATDRALGNATGTLALGNGGTGQTTAQAAIDALTAVSAATNEHVLTKDTATGNAKWKAATGSSGAISNIISTPTTIAADTSYIVLDEITLDDELTIDGNLGVI